MLEALACVRAFGRGGETPEPPGVFKISSSSWLEDSSIVPGGWFAAEPWFGAEVAGEGCSPNRQRTNQLHEWKVDTKIRRGGRAARATVPQAQEREIARISSRRKNKPS
jgi:hypothetical protein